MGRPRAVRGSRYPQHDVVVEGCRLRYVDVGPLADDSSGGSSDGGGSLPLFVIPGHTSRIEGFDDLLSTLAQYRRVLVCDFPGSGYSEKPDRRYDLRYYEDVAVGFLDSRGVDRAVPVGGSLGGNMVLRLGHRFPDRFPMLALWSPGSAWTASPRLAAVTHWIGDHPSVARALFWPTVKIQSRFWYDRDFAGRAEALRTTFAYYREVMSVGFLRMYWGIAADQLATSLFDIAPDITQPTLLMWGDQDHGAGMGNGVARLAELLPEREFHVFEGARHSVETEIPDAVAERVLDSLTRWAGPDAGVGRA